MFHYLIMMGSLNDCRTVVYTLSAVLHCVTVWSAERKEKAGISLWYMLRCQSSHGIENWVAIAVWCCNSTLIVTSGNSPHLPHMHVHHNVTHCVYILWARAHMYGWPGNKMATPINVLAFTHNNFAMQQMLVFTTQHDVTKLIFDRSNMIKY